MTSATETVSTFYAALGRGDAPAALGLMAADIEWTTMWHYHVDGRGPQKVAEGLLALHRAGFAGTTLSFVDYAKEFPYFRDHVLPMLEARGLRGRKQGAVP